MFYYISTGSHRFHLIEISSLAEAAVMGSMVIKTITNGGDTVDSRAKTLEAFTKKIMAGK